MTAHNVCGSSYTQINSFSTVTPAGSCPVGTTAHIGLVEDFEAGASEWTHGGLGDTWSLVNSGGDTHFFAEDVENISDQWLISPPIDLPEDHNRAELSFWNYQSIQDEFGGCVDGALLEVSTDGGGSWNAIEGDSLITDPYDGTVSGNRNPLQGSEAWCGDPQNWLESVIRLDEYIGDLIHLRFRLGTDDSIGHNGWKVDDLQIQTCKPISTLDKESYLIGLPGSTVVHRFTLENLGSTETYHVIFSGNEWETTLLSPNPITVTSGTSQMIEIAVHIPELMIDKEHGMDTFTLKLIAENIPVLEINGQGTTVSVTNSGVEFTPIEQTSSTYLEERLGICLH
jgi:hypothetical protein